MEKKELRGSQSSATCHREAQNDWHSPLSLEGEGGLGGKESLILFDFDGTLTTRDTLIAFIRYVHGTRRTVTGFLRYLPQLMLMKLHLYPNWKAKQKIFTHFFAGMSLDDFNDFCRRFAADNRQLLRPQGLAVLRHAIDAGAQVMVVSASIDNWVAPFFCHEENGHHLSIVGTRIAVVDGKVTGRFLTANCYGPEKVRRVQALLSRARDHYHITAYGDSRGDKEMLQYADERHYKPFR